MSLISAKKYRLVYSIGEHCACAEYLRRCSMRHASGPLDWLRGPSVPRMMELVMRDFAGFMQQENMCFSGPGEANDHFDRYIDKANGISFMHDFPAGVALSESYPAVKAKYERRIERFLREVRSVNRVLLVYLTFTTQYRDEDLTESFRRLRQQWKRRLREWGCNTLCLVLPRSDWRKRMRKKMNVLNLH